MTTNSDDCRGEEIVDNLSKLKMTSEFDNAPKQNAAAQLLKIHREFQPRGSLGHMKLELFHPDVSIPPPSVVVPIGNYDRCRLMTGLKVMEWRFKAVKKKTKNGKTVKRSEKFRKTVSAFREAMDIFTNSRHKDVALKRVEGDFFLTGVEEPLRMWKSWMISKEEPEAWPEDDCFLMVPREGNVKAGPGETFTFERNGRGFVMHLSLRDE